MLTEVKNQLKVNYLSIKYGLMREMINKFSFLANIIFMIINNSCFIIQWVVLYSLKESIGGYTFKQMLLLWGIAASTFGVSRFFFKKAFTLSETINTGKLDAFLVQPKNVLLSAITTDIEVSAIGDLLYGYVILIIYGITLENFLLFTVFTILGGLIITCVSVIANSLAFWFNMSDVLADTINNMMITFGTYPKDIFTGIVKILLYTLIPVGIANYIPIDLIINFNIYGFLLVFIVTILLVVLSFYIFNKGLKRYSSSNLMSSRI